MNLKNLDKSLIKRLSIIIGIILIIFIIICIFVLVSNSKKSYEQIESMMINSAKAYYNEHSDELPQTDNGVVTISSEKLIENENLKPLNKLVKDKDAVCSGQVTVTKVDDYLLYSATLNCGEHYETMKLKDVITKQENIVSSGNGLYNINNAYVFRGDNVNNYVSFAGKEWHILRVNEDGTIRLLELTKRDKVVWDDRYNSEKQYNVGINNYHVSRIKDSIDAIYDEFSDTDRAYLVKQNLCVGKRNGYEQDNSGSLECSNTIENQSLGLIQLNEYALASLDTACTSAYNPECTNYNYLTSLSSFWTLTADNSTTHKVFKISGSAFTTNASATGQVRLVVNINANVNYVSGDGTYSNPYKFK